MYYFLADIWYFDYYIHINRKICGFGIKQNQGLDQWDICKEMWIFNSNVNERKIQESLKFSNDFKKQGYKIFLIIF